MKQPTNPREERSTMKEEHQRLLKAMRHVGSELEEQVLLERSVRHLPRKEKDKKEEWLTTLHHQRLYLLNKLDIYTNYEKKLQRKMERLKYEQKKNNTINQSRKKKH